MVGQMTKDNELAGLRALEHLVDTVLVSAIAAVALQWFRYLTHMSTDTSIAIVGATVVREDLFKTIAPDHQKVLLDTAKKAHATLVAQVQKEDQNAYKTLLARGIKECNPLETKEQQDEWKKVNDKLIQELTGKVFSKDLLERVRAAAKQ